MSWNANIFAGFTVTAMLKGNKLQVAFSNFSRPEVRRWPFLAQESAFGLRIIDNRSTKSLVQVDWSDPALASHCLQIIYTHVSYLFCGFCSWNYTPITVLSGMAAISFSSLYSKILPNPIIYPFVTCAYIPFCHNETTLGYRAVIVLDPQFRRLLWPRWRRQGRIHRPIRHRKRQTLPPAKILTTRRRNVCENLNKK